MSSKRPQHPEVLAAELHRLIDEAEALFESAGIDDEKLSDLRGRVNDTIAQARQRLAELEESTLARGRRAVTATTQWVRTNPWTSIAIGGGVGLIVGTALWMHSNSSAALSTED